MEHPRTIQLMMEHSRAVRRAAYARVIVVIAMIVLWLLTAVLGYLLMAGPWGDMGYTEERGRVLVLGLSEVVWGHLHFGSALTAIVVTVIHFAMELRPFRGSLHQVRSRRHGPVLPGDAAPYIPAPTHPRAGSPDK
jgi:hypothetical protein